MSRGRRLGRLSEGEGRHHPRPSVGVAAAGVGETHRSGPPGAGDGAVIGTAGATGLPEQVGPWHGLRGAGWSEFGATGREAAGARGPSPSWLPAMWT